jgi:hypothetical protein
VKKGEQPEFSAKWWKDSQPKGLKTASQLEDALKGYDGAKKKLEKGRDSDSAQAAKDALGGIETAVKAVIAEASKIKNNPDMDATVDTLKKFGRAYGTEEAWIEEHWDDDDDESVFADPEAYQKYLLGALKRLRSSGQMNFGFVLGKKAENHRLALHKSKGTKALGNMLVQQTGLHQFTFGVAVPDPDQPMTLRLMLEGRQLPGMQKKGARMLKKFKPLPFMKFRMFVDGAEVQDLPDPDDTDVDEPDDAPTEGQAPTFDAAALRRELAELIGRIAAIADPRAKENLGERANYAKGKLDNNDLPGAAADIAGLRRALEAATVGQGGPTGTGTPGGAGAVAYGRSRLAWLAARKKIESEMNKLGDDIGAAYQADGIAPELKKLYQQRVSPILAALDESLADKLDEAISATHPDVRSQLVREAQDIMQRYQETLADPTVAPIIADLDNNPFVKLKIHDTISGTLTALQKAVH